MVKCFYGGTYIFVVQIIKRLWTPALMYYGI